MTSILANSGSESVLDRSLSAPSTSAIQTQVEGLVTDFVSQATDLKTLGALTAGGLTFRAGRLATLAAGSRYLSTVPSLVRMGSLAIGLAGESATFAGIQRGFRSLEGQVPTQSFGKEWLVSAISLGSLKLFGKLGEGQNLPLQHLFTDFGMVGAHHAAYFVGLEAKPEGNLASQLLIAEAMNWQMKAGMSLVHGLAPRVSATERAMDLTLKTQENNLGSLGSGIFRPLSPALAVDGPSTPLLSSSSEGKEIRPTLMAMSSLGKGEEGLRRKDYPHVYEKEMPIKRTSFTLKAYSREPLENSDQVLMELGQAFTDILISGDGKPTSLEGPLVTELRSDSNLRRYLLGTNFKKMEIQFDAQGREILTVRLQKGDLWVELLVARATHTEERLAEKARAWKESLRKLATPIVEMGLSFKALEAVQSIELIYFASDLIGKGDYPPIFKRNVEDEIWEAFQRTVGFPITTKINQLEIEEVKQRNREYVNKILDTPIKNLSLSATAINPLRRQGIKYVGQLVQMTSEELLKIHLFGRKGLHEVKDKLFHLGFFYLGVKLKGWVPPKSKLDEPTQE
jgi:hypothetical protein